MKDGDFPESIQTDWLILLIEIRARDIHQGRKRASPCNNDVHALTAYYTQICYSNEQIGLFPPNLLPSDPLNYDPCSCLYDSLPFVCLLPEQPTNQEWCVRFVYLSEFITHSVSSSPKFLCIGQMSLPVKSTSARHVRLLDWSSHWSKHKELNRIC